MLHAHGLSFSLPLCGSLKVFGAHKLLGSGNIRCGLVRGGWMTRAFKPDLKAGEHTFNQGHIFCWKPVRSSAYMPPYSPLNCKQALWVKCFLYRVVVSPHSNRNLTSTPSRYLQRAEDDTVESVLSFHHVGLGHQTKSFGAISLAPNIS